MKTADMDKRALVTVVCRDSEMKISLHLNGEIIEFNLTQEDIVELLSTQAETTINLENKHWITLSRQEKCLSFETDLTAKTILTEASSLRCVATMEANVYSTKSKKRCHISTVANAKL